MPRRATEERVFERTSGKVKMRMEAGALFDGQDFVPQPLPYGPKPRLVMIHITT